MGRGKWGPSGARGGSEPDWLVQGHGRAPTLHTPQWRPMDHMPSQFVCRAEAAAVALWALDPKPHIQIRGGICPSGLRCSVASPPPNMPGSAAQSLPPTPCWGSIQLVAGDAGCIGSGSWGIKGLSSPKKNRAVVGLQGSPAMGFQRLQHRWGGVCVQ